METQGEGTVTPGKSKGIIETLGALPPGAIFTEEGLASIFDKCTASIKAAVERDELPLPVRLMGYNSWTAGSIVRHHEERMARAARQLARLKV